MQAKAKKERNNEPTAASVVEKQDMNKKRKSEPKPPAVPVDGDQPDAQPVDKPKKQRSTKQEPNTDKLEAAKATRQTNAKIGLECLITAAVPGLKPPSEDFCGLNLGWAFH